MLCIRDAGWQKCVAAMRCDSVIDVIVRDSETMRRQGV